MRRIYQTVLTGGLMALLASASYADVSITKIRPDKVRYLAGEEAEFTVQLKNTGKEPWQGRVSGEIESGLAGRAPVFDREMTLAAGEEKKLTEKYKISQGEFGHALHVVADNGQNRIESREIFCVGPWYFNMGRYLTIFALNRYKSPEQALTQLGPKWRDWYVTCIEHFSGSPGQWNGLTPTAEKWYSGQSGCLESATGERSVITAAHSLGIAVTVYEINGTCSMVGEEYSRAHPEWINYDHRGRQNHGYFNMGMLDTWRNTPPEKDMRGCPLWVAPDISKPEVQDADLNDIIRCVKMFGFDGIRWDGHECLDGYDIHGKKISEDLDATNAAWTSHMRSTLQKALPGFTINYNHHPQNIEEGPKWPRTYKALGPNSYVLWESMRGRYHDTNDPLNVWSNFVDGVRNEINDYARPNGNFQWFGWYVCDSVIQQNHTQAVYYSLGGHWCTWTGLKYDAFSMRYGAYLWDMSFKNLKDGSELVQVCDPDNRLWWKNFVQVRPREGGGRIIVTHVLNKPVHERQNPFEKDAPPKQHEVKLTLALPAGENVLKAYVLNPDADRNHWCTEVKPAMENGKASVVMPEVEYWSFVVWEVGK